MRVILTGGGTGGHIFPALSIKRDIKRAYPDATFLYIGSERGLEGDIVKEAGIDFKSLTISGLRRKLTLQNVKVLYQFATAIRQSKKYIKAFQPDIVIGTGGYVCAPVVYAAAKLGIKTIVHEQNSLPGITNQFLGRYVDRVLTCFKAAHKHFDAKKIVLTGNPRATEVVETLKLGKVALGLNPHKKTVLISGGSQGAKPLNDAVLAKLGDYEKANYEVVFVTGRLHFEQVQKEIENLAPLKNIHIKPFLPNMPQYLVMADLFVGRAGATTLSEITALGVPSTLIPSPYVAENHQEHNARSVTDIGGGKLLLQKDLNGDTLFDAITTLTSNDENLRNMGEATLKIGIPDASGRILKVIEELIQL